jgi:dipeptide/tripeptide permease
MNGWWTIAAIAVFSIGEMSASPTKLRYIASIAPPGREGLYLGYANMTVGIGWSVGSVVAGNIYQTNGDKVELAKRYLVEHGGVSRETVAGLERANVLEFFQTTLGVDAWQTRQMLWETYRPYEMWLTFTLIGLGSMVFLIAYDFVTRRAARDPAHSFNTKGRIWVISALVPIIATFAYFGLTADSDAVWVLAAMFGLVLVAALWPTKPAAAKP